MKSALCRCFLCLCSGYDAVLFIIVRPSSWVDPTSTQLVTTDEWNSKKLQLRGVPTEIIRSRAGSLRPPSQIMNTAFSSQANDISLLDISSQTPHCASHTGSSGFSIVPRNLFVVTRQVSSFPSFVAITLICVSQQSQLVDVSRPEFLLRKP